MSSVTTRSGRPVKSPSRFDESAFVKPVKSSRAAVLKTPAYKAYYERCMARVHERVRAYRAAKQELRRKRATEDVAEATRSVQYSQKKPRVFEPPVFPPGVNVSGSQ